MNAVTGFKMCKGAADRIWREDARRRGITHPPAMQHPDREDRAPRSGDAGSISENRGTKPKNWASTAGSSFARVNVALGGAAASSAAAGSGGAQKRNGSVLSKELFEDAEQSRRSVDDEEDDEDVPPVPRKKRRGNAGVPVVSKPKILSARLVLNKEGT